MRNDFICLKFPLLIVVIITLIHVGCGKDDSKTAGNSENSVYVDPIDAATSGIQINVKNNYSLKTGNQAEILSVKTCPLPLDELVKLNITNPFANLVSTNKLIKLVYDFFTKGLCHTQDVQIKDGEITKMLISPEVAESLFKKGSGNIIFLFNDSNQKTNFSYPCWESLPNIHDNFQRKQIFNIEITGAYNLTYSCKLKKDK